MKATRLLIPAALTGLLLFVAPQLMLLSRAGDGSVWLRLFDPLYAAIFWRSVLMLSLIHI